MQRQPTVRRSSPQGPLLAAPGGARLAGAGVLLDSVGRPGASDEEPELELAAWDLLGSTDEFGCGQHVGEALRLLQ